MALTLKYVSLSCFWLKHLNNELDLSLVCVTRGKVVQCVMHNIIEFTFEKNIC